jgi:class 3 adenylate cyclase
MSGSRPERRKQRSRGAAHSQQELEKRIFHLRTLHEVSREIFGITDTTSITRNLLLMVVGTLGVERGVIVLVDSKDNSIAAESRRGCDDAVDAALSSAVAAGVVVKLCASQETVFRQRADASDLLTAVGLDVWIPFTVNETLVGGLGLGPKLTDEPYTDDDCELLVTLANQAAVALRNAAAHEQVVRYAEELAATLKRIQILESMKTNLAKFVPKAVQALIEQSPEAPVLDKHHADVSVLFADITGYTRLSAQLELDRVNQLVEVYFGAFLDEIVKHGGDVNETAGDGLMVIFHDGDPRTHALAAVRAGLAIQQRTAEINGTLDGFFDPIRMHVGINSGIASVGVTKIEGAAGTRWTYTASGTTTNLAARLAALGEGGHVVVSEETLRRLDSGFAAEDMGFQALKNVAEPVRVYRVTAGVSAEASTAPLVERRRHPRRPVAWPARIWIDERCIDASVVNVSLYGVCLAPLGNDLLSIGESYRLEILSGDEVRFRCSAKVCHISERGSGMETNQPCPLTS